MFALPGSVKIFFCTTHTDMRKSYDSLAGVVRGLLKNDPLSGHLFVFYNRRKTLTKVLYWDRNGYVIWQKRLAQGTFRVPTCCDEQLELRDLYTFLEGIVPKRYHKRYRKKS